MLTLLTNCIRRKWAGLLTAALLINSAVPACLGSSLVTVSIDRGFWASLFPQSDETAPRKLSSDVSKSELQQLSNYDIVLLIDRSRSMTKIACQSAPMAASGEVSSDSKLPQPISRWQWCHEQTVDLSEKTKGSFPTNISVVPFSKDFEQFNNVDSKTIETIFSTCTPNGGTNTASALKSQFDDYFARREQLGTETKPLLIAVITDGCPDDASKLRYTIVDATKKLKSADEIAITFLQVGDDQTARRVLEELDNDSKAQYDIVNVVPFEQMRSHGLARALVDTISKKVISQN